MRDFVVLFLIACHVTIPQASPSVTVDSMEDTNDYELDAIKNSDVDQYEAELHLKSEGLRSSSKYFDYGLVKSEVWCKDRDSDLSKKYSLEKCAEVCANEIGCHFFVFWVRKWEGWCYWTKTWTENGKPICEEGEKDGGWDEHNDGNLYQIIRPPTCGYRPIKYHHYCKAKWEELGDFPYADGVSDCASKCKDTPGCKYFFIYIYKSGGHCYQSFTESEDCKEGWKKATYDSYVLDEDNKPDACNPNPCKNGSECSKDNHGRFKCKCQDGYYGSICIDDKDWFKKIGKSDCSPPKELKRGGFHCNDDDCINGNIGYSDLETAWQVCRYYPECQRIMERQNKFYLREFHDVYDSNSDLKYVDWDCPDTEKLYDVNNCQWVSKESWYSWPFFPDCGWFICGCGDAECPNGWLSTEKQIGECEKDYCKNDHPGFGPSCTTGEKKWCCKKL